MRIIRGVDVHQFVTHTSKRYGYSPAPSLEGVLDLHGHRLRIDSCLKPGSRELSSRRITGLISDNLFDHIKYLNVSGRRCGGYFKHEARPDIEISQEALGGQYGEWPADSRILRIATLLEPGTIPLSDHLRSVVQRIAPQRISTWPGIQIVSVIPNH
jgi:hypothetical protein